MPYRDEAELAAYQASYRATHKTQIAEKNRRWHRQHRDERVAYHILHADKRRITSKAWAVTHSERVKANARAYRLAHKSERREYKRNVRFQYPEQHQAELARRRARIRSYLSDLTAVQWKAIKAAYHFRCAYCGERKRLTQDHVVALANGGGTTMSNIVPACQTCNSRKGVRLPMLPLQLVLV